MAEDSMFESRLREVLWKHPVRNEESGPVELLPHLYIGNYADAGNTDRLRQLGITHVVNCAAFSKSDKNPYAESTGIHVYKQFHADDSDNYDMLQHFQEAKAVIDDAREQGGKALVHCAMGVNRSGVICVAYMMTDLKLDLVETVRRIKDKRGMIICNRGFRKQLIHFARKHELLNPA